MNRRQFFGAMIAPVGAIAAAKVLPIGYAESARTKLMRWFHAGAPPMKIDPAPRVLQTRLHEGGIWSPGLWTDTRAKQQAELNKYLRARVDQAAFEMMKGDLDGKV